MKKFWNKFKPIMINVLSVVVAILMIIGIPIIIIFLYLLASKKRTIRFHPRFEIVEIEDGMDVDTAVAKEGVQAALQILERIRGM